jgi:hypothetical protein
MRTVFPAVSLALALALGALHQPAQAATGSADASLASRESGPRELAMGFLDIASDPPAEITIDDNATGKITPQPHLELPVGHHKLTLVARGPRDAIHKRTLGFNIQQGETTKLTVHLSS